MAVIPVGGALPALPSLPTMPTAPTGGATGSAEGFAGKVAQAMDGLQALHSTADETAQLAATGQLTDPSEYLIAATQASLATELTVAVRNKAVEAFNSIMSMGI